MKWFIAMSGVLLASNSYAFQSVEKVLAQNIGLTTGLQISGRHCELEVDKHSLEVKFTFKSQMGTRSKTVIFHSDDFSSNPDLPQIVGKKGSFSPEYFFYFSENLKLEAVYKPGILGGEEIECQLPEQLKQEELLKKVMLKNSGTSEGRTDTESSCSISIGTPSESGTPIELIFYTKTGRRFILEDPYTVFYLGSSNSKTMKAEFEERLISPRYLELDFDSQENLTAFRLSQMDTLGSRTKTLVHCLYSKQ